MTHWQWEGRPDFSAYPHAGTWDGSAPPSPAAPLSTTTLDVPVPADPPRSAAIAPVHQTRGHHPLVFGGMALVFGAVIIRLCAWLLRLEPLDDVSLAAMALGAFVFVLGRLIRLDAH